MRILLGSIDYVSFLRSESALSKILSPFLKLKTPEILV